MCVRLKREKARHEAGLRTPRLGRRDLLIIEI
jgi:hypothetical protein